jgi:fructose/tagatose bisphosphate aldolase
MGEARRFAARPNAIGPVIGNIHGAIWRPSDRKKVTLRHDHRRRCAATGVPLVLRGGSSVRRECLLRHPADAR